MCQNLNDKEMGSLKDGKRVKALEQLVKQKDDALKVLTAAGDKLQTKPDQIETALDTLLKARKDAEDKAATLQTQLTEAKKESDTAAKKVEDLKTELAATVEQRKIAATTLKTSQERLASTGINTPDLPKGIEQLAASRKQAEDCLNGVVRKLENARYLTGKADPATLFKALDQVVAAAQIKDPKGNLAASEKAVAQLAGELAHRPTEEQLLDAWLPLLVGPRPAPAAAGAKLDAERTLKTPQLPPAVQSKARLILGLVQRQQGDLVGARVSLARDVNAASVPAAWQEPVRQVLETLTNPASFYLPRARELYEAGQDTAALAVLDEAVPLFPGNGLLLALRSQARLNSAYAEGTGSLEPSNPALVGAQKDAEAAAATGLAEGYYAVGRIAEALGDLAAAQKNYRKALSTHSDKDEAGSLYRMALARVLLKLQRGQPAEPADRRTTRSLEQLPVSLILVLALGEEASPNPVQEQTRQLADEVLATKEASFADRAQALAIKGLWNQALQTYAEGLRPYLRRDYSDGLLELIRRHPGLRRPDSREKPDPQLANEHYISGLRFYTAHQYADAEHEFIAAIENSKQDARYFYYLGLTAPGPEQTGGCPGRFRTRRPTRKERLTRSSRRQRCPGTHPGPDATNAE